MHDASISRPLCSSRSSARRRHVARRCREAGRLCPGPIAGRHLQTHPTATDALAYALARMPATYAAVAAGLNALSEIKPDFAPATLLDVGAGPGTATWAAAEILLALQISPCWTAILHCAARLGLADRTRTCTSMRYEPGDARRCWAK